MNLKVVLVILIYMQILTILTSEKIDTSGQCPVGFYGQDCTCSSEDLANITKYELKCSNGTWEFHTDVQFDSTPLNIMYDTLSVNGEIRFSQANLNLSVSNSGGSEKIGRLFAKALYFEAESQIQVNFEGLVSTGELVFAKYNESDIATKVGFSFFDNLKYCREIQFSVSHDIPDKGTQINTSVINMIVKKDHCGAEKESAVVLLATYCTILFLDVLLVILAITSFYVKKLRALIWYPKFL